MDLGVSDKLRPLLDEVTQFIATEVVPYEKEFYEEIDVGESTRRPWRASL